jgi:hypothetical protein
MHPLCTKPMEKTVRFQPKFEWPGIAGESATADLVDCFCVVPGPDGVLRATAYFSTPDVTFR